MTETFRRRLHITEEMKQYIEKYWGPIEELGDDDAEEIANEYTTAEIKYAYFMDDETIVYVCEEYVDDEDEDAPYPAFTPEYLNYIGMSMSDFI